MEVLGSSCSKAPQAPIAQATVAPELGPRGQRRVGGGWWEGGLWSGPSLTWLTWRLEG